MSHYQTKSNLDNFTANELMTEYMKRANAKPVIKVTSPQDVYPLLHKYANNKHESFICIYLDGAHNIISHREVFRGTLNRTIVHPREVFKYGLINGASGIIVAHNHPSGCPDPSKEDIALTERLREAGEILGLNVLDHVIVSKKGYYSFLEEGLL